jgi:hypothetical protein
MYITIETMYELVVSYLNKKIKLIIIFLYIEDILIIGKVGYEIIIPGDEILHDTLGEHGYDNRAESMHPIFYGFGPAFRCNILAEPFRNVDLYPLMSYILRLNQRVTNGSLNNVKHILFDFQPDIYSKIIGK